MTPTPFIIAGSGMKRLMLVIWICAQGVTFAWSAPVDKPPYPYPDIWARNWGPWISGMVVSWTKHGKPVAYDAHDVLLNACAMYKMCGRFFFSGQRVNGTWGYSQERNVIEVKLNDGSVMRVKNLSSYHKDVPGPTIIEFRDGRQIRYAWIPLHADFMGNCQAWNRGFPSYYELLDAGGRRLWAKYVIFRGPPIQYDRIGNSEPYFVSYAVDIELTPDERMLLVSLPGLKPVVRLDPATGNLDKPHPDVRVVDADALERPLHSVFDDVQKRWIPQRERDRGYPDTEWVVTDPYCANKFDAMLYRETFKQGK